MSESTKKSKKHIYLWHKPVSIQLVGQLACKQNSWTVLILNPILSSKLSKKATVCVTLFPSTILDNRFLLNSSITLIW